MRRLLICGLLISLALLSGCSLYSLVPSGNSQYTIVNERAENVPEAPINDRDEDFMQRVGLYFVSSDRQQLTPISRTLTVRYDDTLLQCMVERLLSASSSDGVLGVAPKGTRLLSVEESCKTVTVDLSSEAINAQSQELLWLKSAIANSILGASDAKYAHILVEGRERGNLPLPTGALSFTNETLQAIWTKVESENAKIVQNAETSPVSRNIVLYYPAANADYVLAQTRAVAIDSPNIEKIIAKELGKAPENEACAQAFYEGASPIDVESVTLNDGGRVVRVVFAADLYDNIKSGPINAWRFFASVVYTFCRNVPDIDGVIVQVGNEWVFDVSSGAKNSRFRDGIMRPNDFADAVADIAELYFADEGGDLVSVGHVMSAKYAKSPRAIINELIDGPTPGEGCAGLFPKGTTPDDVLGIRVDDHAALINFSSRFYSLCQNITFVEERNLVYSIVNTLCRMENVNRARIFIEGESADTLSDYISIKTELLPDPGLAVAKSEISPRAP